MAQNCGTLKMDTYRPCLTGSNPRCPQNLPPMKGGPPLHKGTSGTQGSLVSTLSSPSLPARCWDYRHLSVCSGFNIGVRDPNLSCHACMARYLTEPSPQPPDLDFIKRNFNVDSSPGINGKRGIRERPRHTQVWVWT